MFLSSTEIKELLDKGEIVCDSPIADDDIRPFGIRLHLDGTFLRPVSGRVYLDGRAGDPDYERVDIRPAGEIELAPGEFLLASTVERFRLEGHLAGFLDGRSTIARVGLFVHASSQIIDGTALYARSITLELYNAGPNSLVLTPNLSIGMLSFFKSSSPAEPHRIHSQYTGQDGATPPRLARVFPTEDS